MTRRLLLVYLGLIANVVAFFAKPLFSDSYIFPWDFRYVQLPLVSFLADELQRGRLPLWDPFTYCGDPIFANIQAAFFYPPVLFAAFVSAHTSLDILPMLLEWVVALHIVCAGISAYHLFRGLGAGMPSAFAGAVIFETGGFFAVQAEHITAVMAVSWMPLAWLAVLRLCRRPTLGWLSILSAAFGLSVLSGLPQATVAVFGSAFVLSILLVVFHEARARLIVHVAAACLLGLGLSAIEFLPTSQVTRYSVAKYRSEWLGSGGGLHWQSFVSLVNPDHYHLFNIAQFKGPGDLSFLYLYGSLAGLALVIFCLARIVWDRRRAGAFATILAVMLIFGAFWMLGDKTPLWRLFFPYLPVSVRIGIHPEFTFCIFTLSFAGLAALGLDQLNIRILQRTDAARWAIALVIAADLYLVGSGRPMNCTSLLEEPGLTRDTFDGSADLLQTVRNTVNRDVPPARIDTMEASINWAECATLTRVPAANGSSPLALENIVRLQMLALSHPGVRWGWYYQLENPDSPVLDIMNVKYLIAGAKAADALKSRPRYRHLADLAGYELYENLSVLPRYFFVSEVASAPDNRIEDLIRTGRADLHHTAFTEQSAPRMSPNSAQRSVRTLSYAADSLELQVDAGDPSFLVLSEAFYPGWRAWIDDHPTSIYRTDIAFRGLLVPAGAHRIRMEFRPGIFDISRLVSAMAFLVLLFFIPLRRRQLA